MPNLEDSIYLDSLCVTSLKGMRNLEIGSLAPITLITGPNGSGKTTFLDAVELIASPEDSGQFLKFSNSSPKAFYNLFDKQQSHPYIRISGKIFRKPYFTELSSCETSSDSTFRGYHYYRISENHTTNRVELMLKKTSLKSTVPPVIKVKRIEKECKKLSLESIAKDSFVKEKVLAFLSLLDNRFSDICSPDFKNTYIIHDTYGAVDESFFSEGVRKILGIADAMSHFHHGILLLDDLEAHLSPQTLYEGISLLYSLAKEKQIQLLITTHSQELIDEFLDLLNFYHQLPNLKIIRLKSDGVTSSFTEFSGKEAYELRMEEEIDFRYEFPKKGEGYENIF